MKKRKTFLKTRYWTKKREQRWYLRCAKLMLAIILLPPLLSFVNQFIPSAPLLNPEARAESVVEVEDNQDIITYIKTIFGRDWKVAYAVARGECRGLHNSCRNVTAREHSVCFFQINIKAHFNKIPGTTLADKELWLISDHRNCTLMAKSIFADSGWYPWTSYTSGTYRRYLNK